MQMQMQLRIQIPTNTFSNTFLLYQYLFTHTKPCTYTCTISCCKTCHLSPITYYLLPVTCYLLPVTCYLLPVTCYLLPVTCYLLPITYYLLPITCYLLPITYYLLPITYYLLPITYYLLPVTHYPLSITHYPLPTHDAWRMTHDAWRMTHDAWPMITHYPLPITHYPLPITHYPLLMAHGTYCPLPVTQWPLWHIDPLWPIMTHYDPLPMTNDPWPMTMTHYPLPMTKTNTSTSTPTSTSTFAKTKQFSRNTYIHKYCERLGYVQRAIGLIWCIWCSGVLIQQRYLRGSCGWRGQKQGGKSQRWRVTARERRRTLMRHQHMCERAWEKSRVRCICPHDSQNWPFSKLLWLDGIAFWSSDRAGRAPGLPSFWLWRRRGSVRTLYLTSVGRKVVIERLHRKSVKCCRRWVMCCFTCRSVLVLWFCDRSSYVTCDVSFFDESLQCPAYFAVDAAEGPDACAKVEIMRLCQMGADAVLATKLSLRLSLSSVLLPRRRSPVCSPFTIRYDNVSASIRELNWSTALDGRRPIYNLARRGRDTKLCHCPQPRASLATCWSMRPTQLGWWLQSGRPFKKKHNPRRPKRHATTSNFKIKPLSFGQTLG